MSEAVALCNAATAKNLFAGAQGQVAGCSPSAVLMLLLKIGHLYKPNVVAKKQGLLESFWPNSRSDTGICSLLV